MTRLARPVVGQSHASNSMECCAMLPQPEAQQVIFFPRTCTPKLLKKYKIVGGHDAGKEDTSYMRDTSVSTYHITNWLILGITSGTHMSPQFPKPPPACALKKRSNQLTQQNYMQLVSHIRICYQLEVFLF